MPVEDPFVVPDVGTVEMADVGLGVIPGISDMDVETLGVEVGVLLGAAAATGGALADVVWTVGRGAGAELVCCVGRTVGLGLGFGLGFGGGGDPDSTLTVAVGIIEWSAQ